MHLNFKLTKLGQKGHAHWLVPAFVLVVVSVVGVRILSAGHAAIPVDNDSPSGIMIQVSTLSPTVTPAILKSWLDSIRANNRNSSKKGFINTITLEDIADQNGNLLTDYLKVIAPYLPGGNNKAFNTAYIGTVDLPWTGGGSGKYIDGIENAAFRTQNVDLSVKVAKAFRSLYPNIQANWYITYEANLAGFFDPNIEKSYITYINSLISSLSLVTPNQYFMWSPAFWTPYPTDSSTLWEQPALKANFTDFFSTVKGHLVLNIQDFVGQSNGKFTKENAVTWLNYLKQNWPAPTSYRTLEVNVEQFKLSSTGVISVGDPTEVPAREQYYIQQGYPVGPSWEIRYWHQRLYGA